LLNPTQLASQSKIKLSKSRFGSVLEVPSWRCG
jgi:hypothetical protein